jgi:hypothetical protein
LAVLVAGHLLKMVYLVLAAVVVVQVAQQRLVAQEQYILTAETAAMPHPILVLAVVVELLLLVLTELALMAVMAVMAQVLILLGVLQLQLVKM